jgi:hypothetical protein
LTGLRFRASRWRTAAIDAGNAGLEAYYDEYIRKVDARLGGTDSHLTKLTELRDNAMSERGSRVEKPKAKEPAPDRPKKEKPRSLKIIAHQPFDSSREKKWDFIDEQEVKDIEIHSFDEEFKEKKARIALAKLPPKHLGCIDRVVGQLSFHSKSRGERPGGTCDQWGNIFLNWNEEKDAQGNKIWKHQNPKTVVHETGHAVAFKLWGQHSDATNPELRTWFRDHRDEALKVAKFISLDRKYAATSSTEFFAESYAAYVLKPKKLVEASPWMYDYLKTKIFGGIEYV